ncbi:MAG: hypothetical protein CMN30_20855 [Sandaracinus sp.]|nr:hypothetical protein [Sandaracinus sp.]|tara:strand:+ start:43 stop:225 length:183 start_codon:yes stop_codon:yes gene_type:complete
MTPADAPPSGERAVRRPLTTRERFDRSRPAGELMADVPWDGVLADADRMTARQFLATLVG